MMHSAIECFYVPLFLHLTWAGTFQLRLFHCETVQEASLLCFLGFTVLLCLVCFSFHLLKTFEQPCLKNPSIMNFGGIGFLFVPPSSVKFFLLLISISHQGVLPDVYSTSFSQQPSEPQDYQRGKGLTQTAPNKL